MQTIIAEAESFLKILDKPVTLQNSKIILVYTGNFSVPFSVFGKIKELENQGCKFEYMEVAGELKTAIPYSITFLAGKYDAEDTYVLDLENKFASLKAISQIHMKSDVKSVSVSNKPTIKRKRRTKAEIMAEKEPEKIIPMDNNAMPKPIEKVSKAKKIAINGNTILAIKAILKSTGADKVIVSKGKSVAEVSEAILEAAHDSKEDISFDMQLGLKLLDRELSNEIMPLIKSKYKDIKKLAGGEKL